MSRNIIQVFLYELQRNLRRKGFLLATFGLPVLLFVLSTGYNLVQSRNENTALAGLPINLPAFDFEGIKKAGFVDLSGEFEAVPEKLQANFVKYETEDAARAALNAKEVDVFYVIQPDYLETGRIVQHLPRFSINLIEDAPVQALVYNTFAPNADVSILQRLQDPLANATTVNLQRSERAADEGSDYAVLTAFSVLFIMAIFLTNGYLMQSIIEEKESRLIEILITTIRPTQLLTGKILAFGVLGLFQMVVWLGFSAFFAYLSGVAPAFSALAFLLNISVPWSLLPVMFAYFILGYLLMAAVYGGVGAIANSAREGPQYAAIFTIITILPYYAFSAFAEAPNSALPVGMSLFPFTAPLAMLMRMLTTTVPPQEIALSLGILALSVVALLWLAGRIFRMQTLLAGQRPRLRDIPSIIRG